MNTVKYPRVHVPLLGQDGNAFSILGRVMNEMRRQAVPADEVEAFHAEATSGNYDHLLQTVMRWVSTEASPEIDSTPLGDSEEFVLPAGTYRLGDPCYSVPDDRWSEWLQAAGLSNEKRNLYATLDGFPVLGLGTQYGDGEYLDQRGRTYGVDAGLIGLVPVDLPGLREDYPDPEQNGVYHVVSFDQPVRCIRYEDGTLVFGDITIPTGDVEDEDEECWTCGEDAGWCSCDDEDIYSDEDEERD